jgi:UDP-N-acetylglucosamine enolpyruvyl transferase
VTAAIHTRFSGQAIVILIGSFIGKIGKQIKLAVVDFLKYNVCGKMAVVKGVKRLHGARVFATDLRAGAALVIAGLNAEGITELEELKHIDRGYENLEIVLESLGAEIKRID